jgi:excisionase family DNA binding protein
VDSGADSGQDAGQERLTIQEAARRLGVSEGAIRKRVARGTLAHDKASDGRVYVYLDAGGTRGVYAGQDEGVHPESSALISQLRDEISYLRDENRRKDEIIMQQALTVRQLAASPSTETPEEAAEAPESAGEASDTAEPRSTTEGLQEQSSPRPWSRRMFGT